MKTFLTFILAITFFCAPTLSWWQQGHILVAQIAKNHLLATNNTEAYNKMQELIKAFIGFTDGRSDTFIEAAVWADDIKENGVKIFDEYHFSNVVYDPEYMFKGQSQMQLDINSINTMGWAWTVLRSNRDGISFQRAFMARYLLHVAGDIHQPLHSVEMFNSKHKNGDLGGNLVKIVTTDRTNSTSINLHAYMDSMAGVQSFTERLPRPLNEAKTDYIESMAGSIEKEYPVDGFEKSEVENVDFHHWVVDSYLHAANDVYPNVVDGEKITEEFDLKMRELCRKQVALGGYRLAYTIQKIFE